MSKVNLFVALAPIARMASVTTPSLLKITKNIFWVELGFKAAKIYDVFDEKYNQ